MKGALSTPEELFAWVDSFTNLERSPSLFDARTYQLDRMRRLLELFGNPEHAFRVIHVAGTKGKGSTSALLASALRAAGGRVGLYTSPHVETPFERMELVGQSRRPELLVRLGNQVRARLDEIGIEKPVGGFPPTTFELYTLLAFLYFRESGCREAVIETGIGGRLDATNLVLPDASVITPLDLEHTDVLGDTIEKIAIEKAGIIKPGAPAFIGMQPPAAKEVFRKACRERGCAVSFLEERMESLDVSVDRQGTRMSLALEGDEPVDFQLALLGGFQAENAALAYMTLRGVRPEISVEQIRAGFAAARLPGRMEVIDGTPPIVLDGAHTPLAIRRLRESFEKVFPGPAILVFGSVSGKKPREMAEILAGGFARAIVSTPGAFKASDPEEVYGIFRSLMPDTLLEREPSRALSRARELSGGVLPILVTGSFYMVAEIRRLLLP